MIGDKQHVQLTVLGCIQGKFCGEILGLLTRRRLRRSFRLDIGADVEAMPNEDGMLVKRVPVWKPKKEGWVDWPAPDPNSYMTMNMCTLDAHQEGLDLRSFHENGWIGYCEMLKGGQGIPTHAVRGRNVLGLDDC